MADTPVFDATDFLNPTSWNMRYEFERVTTQTGVNDSGLPQYKEHDIMLVYIPTDTGHPDIVPAGIDEYCARHPEARARVQASYAKWKETKDQPLDGYPLKHIAGIPAAARMQFEFMGIITAEQLINATDGTVCRVHKGKEYQQAVKRLLEVSEKRAEAQKMAKENEDMKTQIAALQAQMSKLLEASKKAA